MLVVRRFASLLAIFATVVATGCVSIETIRVRPTPPSGTCMAKVMFTPPAPGAYEVLGTINAYAGALAPGDEVYEQVRQRACSEGADAVFITNPSNGQCNWLVIAPHEVTAVMLERASLPTAPQVGAMGH